MKRIVLEVSAGVALVMNDDGTFERIRNDGYTVGQQIVCSPVISFMNSRMARLIAMAACILLFCGLSIGTGYICLAPSSYIYLDINPSIRLDINRLNRVVKVVPLNEDARELLESHPIRSKKPAECIDKIVDACREDNYIKREEEAHPVSIGVYSGNIRLSEELSSTAARLEEAEDIAVSVYSVDEERNQEALDLGVSAIDIHITITDSSGSGRTGFSSGSDSWSTGASIGPGSASISVSGNSATINFGMTSGPSATITIDDVDSTVDALAGLVSSGAAALSGGAAGYSFAVGEGSDLSDDVIIEGDPFSESIAGGILSQLASGSSAGFHVTQDMIEGVGSIIANALSGTAAVISGPGTGSDSPALGAVDDANALIGDVIDGVSELVSGASTGIDSQEALDELLDDASDIIGDALGDASDIADEVKGDNSDAGRLLDFLADLFRHYAGPGNESSDPETPGSETPDPEAPEPEVPAP